MTQTQQEVALQEMAGEYVLGTMPDAERVRFEQLMADDLGLQAEVSAWEERLLPMLDLVQPVQPPAGLWSQVEQKLQTGERPEHKSGFWGSLVFWRNLGMVAATMVLVLGLTIFGFQNAPVMDQLLMVTGDKAQVQWVVGTTSQANRLRVKAVAPPELPPGMVCQLWMENPDAQTGWGTPTHRYPEHADPCQALQR